MRKLLIILFALASCTAARATPLPAADRAALMTGTNNSCLENQVKDPVNKAMTVGQLQTYCDCYARAFSDYIQVENLDKIKDTLTPETMRKATEFSQACSASAKK